jgi:phospholipase/lecithinase/hemolysin
MHLAKLWCGMRVACSLAVIVLVAACATPSITNGPRLPPTLDVVRPGSFQGSRVVVFGDSLSDTGALKRASLGFAPSNAYFEGRFTNAKTWNELLADALGVPHESFAQGGAKVLGDDGTPLAIHRQIRAFLAQRDARHPIDTALYVVWGGGNDYFQGADDAAAVAQGLLDDARLLLDAGARDVLLLETLVLSALPGGVRGVSGRDLDVRVAAHNAKLRNGVVALRAAHPQARIALASPQRLRDEVFEHPADFGIEDVAGVCYGGGIALWEGGPSDRCPDATKFFYFDHVHPTGRVHCAFAVAALEALVDVNILDAPIDEAAARARCTTAPAAF